MLEIAVCALTVLIDYPQNLTNADILGQGNLNLVSEKSGKSQGIFTFYNLWEPCQRAVVLSDSPVSSATWRSYSFFAVIYNAFKTLASRQDFGTNHTWAL